MVESPRFERLASVFEQVRTLEPADRSAFLDAACEGDADLREQIEALLASHDSAGVLDAPVQMPAADEVETSMPERIGRYRIIEQLGRGGMGTVYRAEQEHPRRTVALKIMHGGLLGAGALRRFEFEADVLGRLQHPGIAQIHEAGFEAADGASRPFFAMELVEGVRLNDYIEQQVPALHVRLSLLCDICDAVQHAHQKGIIHRDLKPANILITAQGRPKILDFGVARATDSDLHATMQTAPGQLVGTIAYMSPEQIDTTPDKLDTRSDVYALGVILYEMLAGQLPYDLGDSSVVSAAKVIGDREPVPLRRIDRAYRGDLNTIVLKALRKDPDRRYQSASDLASDVRRYLGHKPISARPATTMYQLSKFARRHRGLVGGAVAAVLVLLLGVIGVTWQAARVASEADTRRDVAEFLREMLTSLDPAKTAGEPLTVRMMLDDAAARLETRFGDAPHVRHDLHNTVGSTYQLLGEYERAIHHLQIAVAGFEEEFGLANERTLPAISTMAHALRELDRLEEAEAILVDTIERMGDYDGTAAYGVRNNLAVVLDALGRTAEAEEIFRGNYRRGLAERGATDLDTLQAQNNLAKALLDMEQLEEAASLLTECLEHRRTVQGQDHPNTIVTMSNLAAAFGRLGRNDEAKALMQEALERSERVLGSDHLHTLRRRTNMIRAALNQQDFPQAVAQAQAQLDVCEEKLGTAHTETIMALELLVAATAFGESLAAAEALALQWHARVEGELGPTNRATGRLALLLYNVYDSWGEEKAAEKERWLQRVRDSSFEAPPHLRPAEDSAQ